MWVEKGRGEINKIAHDAGGEKSRRLKRKQGITSLTSLPGLWFLFSLLRSVWHSLQKQRSLPRTHCEIYTHTSHTLLQLLLMLQREKRSSSRHRQECNELLPVSTTTKAAAASTGFDRQISHPSGHERGVLNSLLHQRGREGWYPHWIQRRHELFWPKSKVLGKDAGS